MAQPLPCQRVIALTVDRVNAVLGTNIERDDVIGVLRGLELGVRAEDDVLHVIVPSFRPDLVEERDLIEEVARIYGYEHIPTTVPGHIIGSGRMAPEMAFEARVRDLLTAAGLFEGLSYSLMDYRLLDLMQFPTTAPERTQIVPLRNPKSEEFTHLRPTMFVSMLESLRNNARRDIENVQIFELGRVFRNTGGGLRFNYAPNRERRVDTDVRVQDADKLPLEQRTAAIAMMGRPWTTRWNGGDSEVDFSWMKGLIEQFLADMVVPAIHFVPTTHPTLHPGRTAEIRSGDRVIGLMGEVHPRVAKNFDLPRRALLAEINVDALMDVVQEEKPLPSLSRFPAVSRDIAFLVQVAQPAEQVQAIITAAAGQYLESVELFDVYQGKGIPEGWRSLAYRLTFRADDRTLSDEEVDSAVEVARKALVDELEAKMR